MIFLEKQWDAILISEGACYPEIDAYLHCGNLDWSLYWKWTLRRPADLQSEVKFLLCLIKSKDRSRANLTIWQTQVLINMILHLMVCILSRYQHLARALTMNLHLGEIDTSHIWYKSKTLSKDRMLHTSDFLAIRVVSIADSAFAIFGLGPQDTVAASRHALSLHANVRRAGFTSKHTQKVKC